ncbi:hypothetical protein CFC21_046876 [Triticum aestivum]|uniref:Uncharacterized protein n=3 Tax=Triticinae TaxID=1648030 RepID=A0A453ELK3_AEGTS|nr:MFS18 protein [Aegilops tauschii subsp. strangulata]XP_044356342.1 MFS18 protein-like [Triticum aestivum]KAF7036128.1 hypothetical protein CFC21_046876 [Triticum aestivum]
MEKSTKMVAVLVLAVLAAATSAEARNIKTTDAAAASKDAVLQPTTFPPFDRLGGLPGGSSMPGFSLPGSSGATPGISGIGSMPFLGGSSPGLGGSTGLGGFGGMPGSPAAAAVDEHAKKP